MSKRVVLCGLVVFCFIFFAGTASADTIQVTGAFTSFTGTVLGQGVSFVQYCPAQTCGFAGPPPPNFGLVCPDSGCGTPVGIAHVPLGGNPALDTFNQLSFFVDTLTTNGLVFQAARDPNSFFLNDVSPGGEFKLGTLTFTNGIWSGDADFGFSIVARDLTTHVSHAFDGLIHMSLTPNTGPTPASRADFIYITDPAGNPVVSPLTLTPLPSFRVFELGDAASNTATVDLFGRFGSLDLTRFDNVTGGGFLDVSLTTDLGGPPTQAPEPATLALFGSALLALVALRKKTP